MIFLLFSGLVLIVYGVLCFVAIDAVWRLSVPEHARGRINRVTWVRVTRISGVLALVFGAIIVFNVLH